ncbi:hypothetical protein JKG47_01805 [Acidithiobacillus sp. MC6.1]|nr:hypothetical protein [Acidithiobacillus sp. MC6.1]
MEFLFFHKWIAAHPNLGTAFTIISVLLLLMSFFSKDFRAFMAVQWFTFAIESAKGASKILFQLIWIVMRFTGKAIKIFFVTLFGAFRAITTDFRKVKAHHRHERDKHRDDPLL